MTYTYKLYTYKNGFDETVYRFKYKGFLGLYRWFVWHGYEGSIPVEYSNRETVMEEIKNHAEKRRADALNREKHCKRNALKLVIIEDISA